VSVCVGVLFQSVQGMCLGAKHLGMLGLADVGTRRRRIGRQCTHVVGAPSARAGHVVDDVRRALLRSKSESRL
jgi:hypothetical protein